MMNRKAVLFSALAVLFFVTSACDVVPTSVLSETSPSPTAVRNVLATHQIDTSPAVPTARPIPAPTLTPEAAPTQTKTELIRPTVIPTAPSTEGFCCLQFAAGPYAQATETFPAGTEIIYAVWNYTGLLSGDRIRRIWIRDNLIWLTREENWDWEKYGAAGTVRDLSIFDFEGSGLQSGEYRLQLYLNDDLQQEGDFTILPQ